MDYNLTFIYKYKIDIKLERTKNNRNIYFLKTLTLLLEIWAWSTYKQFISTITCNSIYFMQIVVFLLSHNSFKDANYNSIHIVNVTYYCMHLFLFTGPSFQVNSYRIMGRKGSEILSGRSHPKSLSIGPSGVVLMSFVIGNSLYCLFLIIYTTFTQNTVYATVQHKYIYLRDYNLIR